MSEETLIEWNPVTKQYDVAGQPKKVGWRANCCCTYGAAVKDEWPEFQCFKCPKHTDPVMAGPKDLCRRHKQEHVHRRPARREAKWANRGYIRTGDK